MLVKYVAQDGLVIGIWNGNDGNKMPVSKGFCVVIRTS